MEVLSFFDKHYKACVAAIIGIIVISIVVIIAVPIIKENSKPTILEIAVAPTTAKIEVDGKEYRNGTHEIEPGQHSIKLSKEGFSTKETTVEVKDHQQTLYADYILNEKEGYKYFERSAADIDMLRLSWNEEDMELREFLDEYDEKIRIRELLPINASYNLKDSNPKLGNYMIFMTISDGSTSDKCHYAFCLRVTGDRKNEKRVREMLKINKFDYDDYEVIYE